MELPAKQRQVKGQNRSSLCVRGSNMDQREQLNRKLRFGDCHLLAQFARPNVITALFNKDCCLSLVSNAIALLEHNQNQQHC